MRSIRSLTAAIAATTGAAVLALASPALAQGPTEVLDIGEGGAVAEGASASVPLTFICDEGARFFVEVRLIQRVGQRQPVVGVNRAMGTCAGRPQTETLFVQPRVGVTFEKGTATASAVVVSACRDTCTGSSERVTEHISIR
jgi:hypothetical protein